MRIRRVSIKNFRCLESVEIDFDDVTTFVGPNGAGKSSILRALDWFFNGTRQAALTVDDVFRRDAARKVEVAVEFDELSPADRDRLGRYAAPGQNSVVIRKSWADGAEKIIGRSRVFPPFQEVRAGSSASERKSVYQGLRSTRPDLDLPTWSNDTAVAQAMADWESSHPDALEDADVESASHFFGFAGQGRMAGLFDFIFVSADMRAAEQVTDSKSSVIGRILERAVDRSAADAELQDLLQSVATQQEAIQIKHFADQLSALSERLTAEVSSLAAGRALQITSETSPPQPQRMQFRVNVIDRELETSVDRQGHGFQRALLIGALKLLAEHGQGHQPQGVVCLAIEEPELYQHPLQARLFAAVLRSLAEDVSRGVQVMYATHSLKRP